MLHIILPNVAAPMRTTSPQRPTNIIVDSSVISRIIALNMIGEAKLAKGISRFAVDDKKPSFSVTGTSMTVGLKMQSSGWCEVPSCSTILRWYVGRNLMKWGRPLVPIAWNFNYLENIHHAQSLKELAEAEALHPNAGKASNWWEKTLQRLLPARATGCDTVNYLSLGMSEADQSSTYQQFPAVFVSSEVLEREVQVPYSAREIFGG